MKKLVFTLTFILTLAQAIAQLSITGAGPFSISFDATVSGVINGQFSGSGFAPSPSTGQLDSDAWAGTGMDGTGAGDFTFGDTRTSDDWARGASTGGVTTGGCYGFTTATSDRCLGIQPGGSDWTPGTITLRIQNNTGGIINSFAIAYEIKVYNDQARANSFNFSHSANNSTYTSVPSLDYTSTAAASGSPSWETISRSTTISGISIANGGYYYLRWSGDDVSGSNNRDEFGLDDIVISSVSLPISLVSFSAEPSSTATRLTFTTALELNNSHFLIERSPNGAQYEAIGRVPGAGNSSTIQEYTFTDEKPLQGINYYRLKQVDFDGQFSYSPVATVQFGETAARLRIAPSPASDEVTVRFEAPIAEPITWAVYDQSSRLLLSGSEDAETDSFGFNVSTLVDGFYVLQVTAGREVMSERFQKK